MITPSWKGAQIKRFFFLLIFLVNVSIPGENYQLLDESRTTILPVDFDRSIFFAFVDPGSKVGLGKFSSPPWIIPKDVGLPFSRDLSRARV